MVCHLSSVLCRLSSVLKGVLMTNKAPFCASLLLIRTVFTRLKNPCNPCNPRLMKSSLCFCTSLRLKTSAISAFSAVKNSCSSCASWLKNPFNQRNLRLTNDLRSTKVYVRNYKLFMQNKANFQKVKFDVNNVLTKDYDRMDTWSIRKTKPIQSQLKPIKANSKPIKANKMPKQTQYKPKQSQFYAGSRTGFYGISGDLLK